MRHDKVDRLITVWEFRSVDGKQVVEAVRPAHIDDDKYQHEYQRILYTGPESGYFKKSHLSGAGSRQKGESTISFMDRVLWGLAARLGREATRLEGRVYLWYLPSTADEWGSVVVAADQPEGYELVAPEAFSMWATWEQNRNRIHDLLRRLPIIPTTDAAFDRGLK